MVEYISQLDTAFGALADPIRRDIIARVTYAEYSIGELVACYGVSFAAISKHLRVLERAGLITKRREGKKRMITLIPGALQGTIEYLEQYRMAKGETVAVGV